MTRKPTRNSPPRVVAIFVGVLTLLIAVAVLAQVTDAGRPIEKSNAVLAQLGTSAPAQGERPSVARIDGAAHFPASPLRTKRRASVPIDSNTSLFLPAVPYNPGGEDPLAVAVADVNGDGKPDLLVVNCDPIGGDNCGNDIRRGLMGVLLGKGDGTFEPAVTYDAGFEAWSLVVADVNGDGKPDVVVVNLCATSSNCTNGKVGVLLGNGDGTFQPVVAYPSGGSNALSAAVADVNGDGKPDLVVANLCGTSSDCTTGNMGVLLGKGDGTFRAAVTYDPGGSRPVSIAAADVNGDGKPDLLVLAEFAYNDSAVGVLLGNGDGTFQPATFNQDPFGSAPQSLAVTDVNGDGKPDLLWVSLYSSDNLCGSSNAYSLVTIRLGKGDGTFPGGGFNCSGGVETFSGAVADVNGDGKLDLIMASACLTDGCADGTDGVVTVLAGNGDGTFQPATVFKPGNGAHSVTVADVNGDENPDLLVVNANTPGVVDVMLNSSAPRSPTTTTLTSSPNPSVAGQPVTLTAVVGSTSGTPTGVVVFSDGVGSATMSGGSASITISSLVAGSHSITAAYQGSSAFSPSTSSSLNQVVNIATTTTTVASSVNPVRINLTVTYTATVTSQYAGTATGTATFQDGGSTIATVTLASNHATYTTSYKTAGTHAIAAIYSGDASNTGSASPTLLEQVQGFPTRTALTTSGSPSLINQPVTFTATVTSGHRAIPDGDLVTFYDGTAPLGSAALAGGTAAFTTSSLSVRTHTIKANYAGDATFAPSTGAVAQIVNKYPTTTTLRSSLNPSAHGQAVTFTAKVASAGPMPTGKAVFKDGTTSIGTAMLSNGVAKLTKSTLAVGTHPITAQYTGDAVSGKSTSAVLNQVVK
jgi:hypothetical protein